VVKNTKVCKNFSRYTISRDGILTDTKKNKTVELKTKAGIHYMVNLYNDDGIRKSIPVWKLVAYSFLPESNYSGIRYLDNDSSNVSANNLERVSRRTLNPLTPLNGVTSVYGLTRMTNVKTSQFVEFETLNLAASWLNISPYKAAALAGKKVTHDGLYLLTVLKVNQAPNAAHIRLWVYDRNKNTYTMYESGMCFCYITGNSFIPTINKPVIKTKRYVFGKKENVVREFVETNSL
jgi:hypothetical protein